MFPDLRRECAAALVDLDTRRLRHRRPFGGRAAPAQPGNGGGHAKDILPRDKPRYAMGVGMPAELPEYVARGVDMMDCVLPSRNARNGYLFTSQGRVIIKHARYKDDAASHRRKLPVLYLSQIFPRLPSPSVPVRGDFVRVTGHPAQRPAVP